jgi:hypothetical protein
MTSMQLPRNLENVALVAATSRKQHAVFGKVIENKERQTIGFFF